MIYASRFPAEKGWKVLLTDKEGKPRIIDIVQFGININGTLSPLDELNVDFSTRENYILLINPNFGLLSNKSYEKLAHEKATKLGWLKKITDHT